MLTSSKGKKNMIKNKNDHKQLKEAQIWDF
jgi:hypothetical protein